MTYMNLEQICSEIVDCEHKTAPIDLNGEFFAVGTPAMKGNRINYGEARRISEETFQKWTKRLSPQMGDLLFAREAPVGPIVQIPDGENVAPGQRTVLLRPNTTLANSRYLFYALSSPLSQGRILSLAAGSTVPHLNVSDIRNFKVELPDLDTQRAIAEVLGALDDKITANNELATAADDLARALFRQALKSATYSDESFADLAEVSGGGTPSTKKPEYWDGTIPWATPTDVTSLSGPYLEETSRTISEMGLKYCSSALYPAGSILMTSRATIGAFALAQVPTAVNQGFIVVQPNDPSLRFWLFHEMRSRVDEFISLANGATFLELSRGNFKKFKVRKATPETMAAFNETAETLHDSARAALLENNSLAATRDALLPQLMSGKIRVREAESIVEDVL